MHRHPIVIAIVIASAAILPARGATPNPFLLSPDHGSASYGTGAFRSMTNPALGGEQRTPFVAYRALFYDRQKTGNHFAALGAYGITALYGRYDECFMPDTKRLDHTAASWMQVGAGHLFGRYLGLGASYSFSASDNRRFKGLQSWSAGVILRPIPYLSIGATVRDLGARVNGSRLAWTEVYSLAVRPATDRVTLSVDVLRRRGASWRGVDIRYGADVRLVNDITIFARGDRKMNITAGLTIPFTAPRTGGPWFDVGYARSFNRGPAPDVNSIGFTLALEGRPGAGLLPGKRSIIHIVLKGGVPEISRRDFWGRERTAWFDVVETVRRAAGDPLVTGIMLQIDGSGLGFAQVQELRDELKAARRAGKKVYAVLTRPDNRDYYLATAADRIYCSPPAFFAITGLSARVYFFKGIMDKVGVKFEAVKRGKYKGAPESYTHTRMSEATRENITALVRDLHEQYCGDIAGSRPLSRQQLEELFAAGGITPDEAQKRGFIDAVMYPDEARREIANSGDLLSMTDYLAARGHDDTWGMQPRIAVVVASGDIVSGRAFTGGRRSSIGDETYRRALDHAFIDPRVRAVVVRVSSGGGSAAASEFMWHHLATLKKKYRKPVVFSFGNAAASGGYYIALTGDRIFADRGTVTGSIGIFFGKISMQGLYEKLGINKETIKMSEFADILTESRDLSDRERAVLQGGIDFLYDRFTGRVMEARKMDAARVAARGEGRVFTGAQGREQGLVDEIGGLAAAVQYARTLAGITGPCEVVKLPRERAGLTDAFALPSFLQAMESLEPLVRQAMLVRMASEGALFLLPYDIEIE